MVAAAKSGRNPTLRLVRSVLGLLAALVLMGALGTAAFVIGRTNPDVPMGVFFGASGVLYTMIILFVLAR